MSLIMTEPTEVGIAARGKNDARYTVDNVFGSVFDKHDGPQVFHVHQLPLNVTDPHFHEVSQFQVFTGGDGRLGRHPVPSRAVHYADAWTSYGPIVAGEHGIDYFTARFRADVGANYMPESRALKQKRSRRHFTVELSKGDVAPASARSLLPEQEDGLAAYEIGIDAGASLELPRLFGSGRLMTVLGGSLVTAQGEWAEWTWGRDEGGSAIDCRAGAAGAIVLCLDFPLEASSS
jgi:hypothetical protein